MNSTVRDVLVVRLEVVFRVRPPVGYGYRKSPLPPDWPEVSLRGGRKSK